VTPRTIVNALGETVEVTWTQEDLDRVARQAGQETIELPADVAEHVARLVRRAPTRRRRPVPTPSGAARDSVDPSSLSSTAANGTARVRRGGDRGAT
jgi:hypothetical protein